VSQRALAFIVIQKIYLSPPGDHNEKVFSRCKSKLVIVCNEEYVERFIAKNQYSNSNAMKIPVSGISMTFLFTTKQGSWSI